MRPTHVLLLRAELTVAHRLARDADFRAALSAEASALRAAGEDLLANALDTQLAATPPKDAGPTDSQ